MNENENNFEALREFLKLKRQEMPPPGYFNTFSGQVIARIRAGEAGELRSRGRRYFSDAPWLSKLLQAFEFKPAFAGAFASALFLMLVFGIVYADRTDSTLQPVLQAAGQPAGSFAAMSSTALTQPADSTGIIASTNPATSLQPVASLFDSQNPLVQQVSFSPSRN
jgi:hypothetical protein